MQQIRFKGFRTGTSVEISKIAVGAATAALQVAAFQKPGPVSGLPRISSTHIQNDTITLDTTGLTGITAYDWREVGGETQGITETFKPASLGNRLFECAVTCDQGIRVSPPFQVYATSMMGMTMPVSHTRDDRAILAIVPHSEATHIVIANGAWSDPATWLEGNMPRNGAVVLIPQGMTVTYDNAEPNIRLDRVRVDGDLIWALDRSTEMCAETLVVTRGGSMVIGTSEGRMPAAYRAEIIISGKDYSAESFQPTDMKIDTFAQTRGWGRGVVVQGTCRIWGREKTTWFKADPIEAGATSLVTRQPLIGVEVGDEICIGGTDIAYTYNANAAHAPVFEDEYRILTAIDGETLSWETPLEHPHKNQLRTSTRTDLYPNVMIRRGKNVIFRSEATALPWRRGHFAVMHHWATMDVWDLECIEFGRTDKSMAAGIVTTDGAFESMDAGRNPDRQTTALTARSNVVARYAVHAHMLGYNHMGTKPIVSNCYVEGTPGWGYVHHDCDVDFVNNVCHRFWGCGMVSEAGSEVGAWVGNLMMTSTYQSRPNIYTGAIKNLYGEPKNLAGPEADEGDTFREGFGYGFRGRGMRTNRNVANSVTFGNVFYHRFNGVDAIQPPQNMRRDVVDIAGQNYPQNPNSTSGYQDDFVFFDYPIVHHADNEAVACIGGLFVSKELHLQDHDVNVKLKRMKTWGYALYGASVEYIGVYIIDGFDAVAGDRYRGRTAGFRIGANTYQNAVVNLRSEGNREAVYLNPQDTTNQHDDFDADDPRWFIIGADSVDDTAYRYTDAIKLAARTKTADDVTLDNRDWDGTLIDYDRDPSTSLPALMAARGDWDSRARNGTGRKSDNVSDAARIFFKPMDDSPFFTRDTFIDTYRNGAGYYTVNSSDASIDGKPCVVQAIIVSDRVTGRPSKRTYFWDITGHVGGTNNGSFTYVTTPVVQNDKTAEVGQNSTVKLDVVSGATGGAGPGSYLLDADKGRDALNGDYIAPDNGVAHLDGTRGEITYTPDRDYTGTDEMYVFVKSQGQYATVRVTFLVGGDATRLDTPSSETHFSVVDPSDANTLGVALNAPPDAGGRRIERVTYSTDEGKTWRRLCHHWVQATHKISHASTGEALIPGETSLQIRYHTNFDFRTSEASTALPVTVS